jgi:hypothetical protein
MENNPRKFPQDYLDRKHTEAQAAVTHRFAGAAAADAEAACLIKIREEFKVRGIIEFMSLTVRLNR